MKKPTYSPEEILKYRHELFDVEILLRHLMRDELYNLEAAETMLLAQTLAKQANECLVEVCAWLEEMQDDTEKREAAKLAGGKPGGLHE